MSRLLDAASAVFDAANVVSFVRRHAEQGAVPREGESAADQSHSVVR